MIWAHRNSEPPMRKPQTLEVQTPMQGYNDGLTSLPQDDDYAEPRLSPALAAKEDFEAFEREAVTKQIFEEGLGLAGVALLKQACAILSPCTHTCTWISANQGSYSRSPA